MLNENPYKLFFSPNIITVIKIKGNKMGGACEANGEQDIAYRVLMWKCEGKRPLGRNRHRGENNTMYLREMGWKGVDWINLARIRRKWQAVINMEKNPGVP